MKKPKFEKPIERITRDDYYAIVGIINEKIREMSAKSDAKKAKIEEDEDVLSVKMHASTKVKFLRSIGYAGANEAENALILVSKINIGQVRNRNNEEFKLLMKRLGLCSSGNEKKNQHLS